MEKYTIWEYLKSKGFSNVAAAALMGNMEAESNCVPYRLQGDFTTGYNRSVEYTRRLDAGTISKNEFVYNGPGGGGYGLMQWTYPSRKAGLYDLAQDLTEAVNKHNNFAQRMPVVEVQIGDLLKRVDALERR